MPQVLVPLPPGCEELEAVTVLVPDALLEESLDTPWDMIVLPGGLPGAAHLEQDLRLLDLLRRQAGEDRYVAAICAAPKVLARAGLLEGKEATAFPGILESVPESGVRPRQEVESKLQRS